MIKIDDGKMFVKGSRAEILMDFESLIIGVRKFMRMKTEKTDESDALLFKIFINSLGANEKDDYDIACKELDPNVTQDEADAETEKLKNMVEEEMKRKGEKK